jgi:hypothetical protein
LADQIVYLDHPANPLVKRTEPAFDPKTILAKSGEQNRFVARVVFPEWNVVFRGGHGRFNVRMNDKEEVHAKA